MERHVPDETQVASHPSLTLPPDFNLRPPGAPTPVSAAHEAGLPAQAMSSGATMQTAAPAAAAPVAAAAVAPEKKEEPGLLSQFFSLFSGGDDKNNSAPASK